MLPGLDELVAKRAEDRYQSAEALQRGPNEAPRRPAVSQVGLERGRLDAPVT